MILCWSVFEHSTRFYSVLLTIWNQITPEVENKALRWPYIRLRVVWVGLKFLLCSTDHVLHFSEHSKRFHSDRVKTDLLCWYILQSLYPSLMENNSRQLLFWHWRVSQHRRWKPTSDWLIPKEDEIKKKKQNISNSWQPLTFLHEQSRSRQQMHSIRVCHLREGWTNNVTTKRQGRCLFPFSCLFESYRKSRVKSPRNKDFIKAAIKGLLWSLFGHDYFNLNLQAVRVGGLTQSFKYASKRHCYDNIIFASIFQISYFLSI